MRNETGGAHGRLEPLVGRLRRLADCDARAGEPLGKCMREAATEIEELRAQVRSLQSALDFWLPGVPAEDSPRQSVIADHAWLLCGFDGEQASAEKLGWITLTPNAQCTNNAKFIAAAHDMADTIAALLAEVERLANNADNSALEAADMRARAEAAEAREAALSEGEIKMSGFRFACSKLVADRVDWLERENKRQAMQVNELLEQRDALESRLLELEAEAIFGGEPIVHNGPECGCAITPPKQCDNSHQWAWQLEEMQRERDDARNRLLELANEEAEAWGLAAEIDGQGWVLQHPVRLRLHDVEKDRKMYAPHTVLRTVALIRRPEMPS